MSDEFGETVDAWVRALPRPQCTCTCSTGDNPQGHSRGCPLRAWLEMSKSSWRLTQNGNRVTVQVGEAMVQWSSEKGPYARPPFTVVANAKPGHLRDLIRAVQAAEALYIEQYTAKGAQR